MQEEKKPSRGKVMGLLAVSLVIQSLSSVFIKYAGTYDSDPGVVSHIVWRESHDSEYYRKHYYYSGDQFAWNG